MISAIFTCIQIKTVATVTKNMSPMITKHVETVSTESYAILLVRSLQMDITLQMPRTWPGIKADCLKKKIIKRQCPILPTAKLSVWTKRWEYKYFQLSKYIINKYIKNIYLSSHQLLTFPIMLLYRFSHNNHMPKKSKTHFSTCIAKKNNITGKSQICFHTSMQKHP